MGDDRAAWKEAGELLYGYSAIVIWRLQPKIAAKLRAAEERGRREFIIEADAKIARMEARLTDQGLELAHWREAAKSIGQADGHGWAEETRNLRAELAALRDQLATKEKQ